MFRSALFAILLACTQWSYAAENQVVTTEAGARADSSTVINGAPPSPVVGLPSLAGSLPPQLFQQLPPPPYVLFGSTLNELSKLSKVITIGDDTSMTQMEINDAHADVLFGPLSEFARYRVNEWKECGKWNTPSSCRPPSEPLLASFTIGSYRGKVRPLGLIMVTSRMGKPLLPTAAMQSVRNALNLASNNRLGSVVLVPVPQGYGINVGVTSDGSAFGLTSTLAKIASIFIGIGPSFSIQNGTTTVTGSWSQQYLVLEEDAEGIPFVIDLVTPQDDGVAAKRDAELRRQVDAARQVAIRALEEAERVALRRNDELEAAMAKLQAEQTVLTPVVEQKAKPKRRIIATTPPCMCEKK